MLVLVATVYALPAEECEFAKLIKQGPSRADFRCMIPVIGLEIGWNLEVLAFIGASSLHLFELSRGLDSAKVSSSLSPLEEAESYFSWPEAAFEGES